MIERPDFRLEVSIGGTSIEVDDALYNNFILYEILHLGIYFAELRFINRAVNFREYPFITGSSIQIDIELVIPGTTFTYNFVLYDKTENDDYISLVLIPEIFATGLGLTKISKGYNDKIDSIINTIATDIGITETEIESTSLLAKKYLQLNQTNFSFIKNNIKYAKNNNSNYLFYIDKNNKLKFYSIAFLRQKKPVYNITTDFIDGLEIDDKSFSFQLESGFGAKGIYWDWDNGEIKDILYDSSKIEGADKIGDKIGIDKTFISEFNDIVMLNPIANDIYAPEDYNLAEIENNVLRKNYFNVFLRFITAGNLDATPAELVDIDFISSVQNESNRFYTGEWIIYSAVHQFPIAGFITSLEIANASLYSNNNPNIV